ncbi:MAG: efflux RND transporter periplasmic adaptor subunit [Proteobacteria bacterium]|nr:efflux RND transporter periplasmic adaptor subunit [Pseudomonadota bacterium]
MKKILLFLSIYLLISACTQEPETVQSINKINIETVMVKKQQQYRKHHIPIYTQSTDRANLAFQVNGVINERLVNIGDVVKKGDVLMTISNPSLEPQIQNFISQKASLTATIRQTSNEISRFKDLKKTNAVSQNDLDKLSNQYDSLIAQRNSIDAQLNNAKAINDESLLKAPFSGSIGDVYKYKGEVISAGQAVLLLGSVDSLESEINLPAHLHQKLTQGQSLEAGYYNNTIATTIKDISLTAQPQTQLFKVKLDVPIEHDIKAGERLLLSLPEYLGLYYKIPIESVVDDGIDEPYVFVIENETIHKQDFKILSLQDGYFIGEFDIDGYANNEIELVTKGHNLLIPKQVLER